VIIVAATAIAALVQLGHLRAGNQINAMFAIGEELSSKPLRDATQILISWSCGALRSSSAMLWKNSATSSNAAS